MKPKNRNVWSAMYALGTLNGNVPTASSGARVTAKVPGSQIE